MDPITLAVGAAIAALSFLAGRRSRRRELTPDKREAICGCGHRLAFHDPVTSECHGEVRGEPLRYDRYDEPTAWKQARCACRQYEGHVPPDQIVANFRPQLPASEER